MSTETQEQEKQYDPLIAAYFDGSEEQQEQEQTKSQDELDAEAKAESDALLETQRVADEQEQQRLNEQEAAAKLAEAEKAKSEESQEKPKRWDEGLSDQAKFVLDKLAKGEEKDVYELLKNKFGYDGLSDEEKAITYLAEKNPHLSKEDLLFKAAEEYGIGVEEIDTDDLTAEQKKSLRSQEIERKGLLNEASKYFDSKKTTLDIPALPNPLETDEGYKEYLNYKSEQVKFQEEQKAQEETDKRILQETEIKVKDTAKEIESLSIELKIDLDQGEFDLKSEFKLDEKKQKQLADYAMDYTPTQAEFKAHQNQNGELDMKGYMTALAHKLFASQIQKAVTKQAITKDREMFTERELKNSTLRNNSNMAQADVVEDFYVNAMKQ